jgi:hypothetical protein
LSGDRVEVGFTDTGRGFSPQALARHAPSFFFSEKEGGMGIGLSVASEIVKAHGGELRAENIAAGGARLTVVLAQVAGCKSRRGRLKFHRASPSTCAPDPRPSDSSPTVQPMPDHRRLKPRWLALALLVKRLGPRSGDRAASAALGLEKLAQLRPPLVILDIGTARHERAGCAGAGPPARRGRCRSWSITAHGSRSTRSRRRSAARPATS